MRSLSHVHGCISIILIVKITKRSLLRAGTTNLGGGGALTLLLTISLNER